MFLLYPKAGPSGSQGKEVLRPGAGHQPSPVAPESHNRGSKAQKWAIASQQQCLQPQTPPHTHSPFLSLSPTMHPATHTHPAFLCLLQKPELLLSVKERKGRKQERKGIPDLLLVSQHAAGRTFLLYDRTADLRATDAAMDVLYVGAQHVDNTCQNENKRPNSLKSTVLGSSLNVLPLFSACCMPLANWSC